MLGFSSVASRRNCCTARCCSIWYLLFIATLSFFLAEKSTVGLLWAASLRVATFYELPGKVLHDTLLAYIRLFFIQQFGAVLEFVIDDQEIAKASKPRF